jgi:uncharacterized RmlC-like cupin family protein
MNQGEPGDLVVVRSGATYAGKQGHTFFAGISNESAGAQRLCLHLITIPPGTRSRPHVHQQHESAIYVVSGDGEAWYGTDLREHFTISAGDFVYVPAGTPHQPGNRSQTEPLIAIVARTDPNEQESVVLLPDPKDG